MSPKQSTPTAYGEVEFETVECDSCGTETHKEHAQRFVIGDVKLTYKKTDYYEVRFERNDVHFGWACPYCREEQILGYPVIKHVDGLSAVLTVLGVLLLGLVVLAVVL